MFRKTIMLQKKDATARIQPRALLERCAKNLKDF